MSKYVIEDCLDFYSELNKTLNILNSDEENTTEDLCLITNEKLTDKYITLNCGHKFNYYPLYKDLQNHKLKFNAMESYNSMLKHNQFRCPYCRAKYSGLMPYYEDMGIPKIPGINCIDYDNAKDIRCNYQMTNHFYNSHEPMTDMNQKIIPCLSINVSSKMMLKIHELNNPDFNDKCYCTSHVKLALAVLKRDARETAKNKKIYNRILKQLVKVVLSKSKVKKVYARRKVNKKNDVVESTQSNNSQGVIDLTNTNVVLSNTIVISTDANTITEISKPVTKKILRNKKILSEETK